MNKSVRGEIKIPIISPTPQKQKNKKNYTHINTSSLLINLKPYNKIIL